MADDPTTYGNPRMTMAYIWDEFSKDELRLICKQSRMDMATLPFQPAVMVYIYVIHGREEMPLLSKFERILYEHSC